MKRLPEDDWGNPLGSDHESVPEPPKKSRRQDSLGSLVVYFSELLPKDAWGKLNSPVNAPALMVGLRKLRDAGHSPDDIRSMMKTFVAELSRKPLPVGVAPWRGFLANLDALSGRADREIPSNYDDLDTDRRL